MPYDQTMRSDLNKAVKMAEAKDKNNKKYKKKKSKPYGGSNAGGATIGGGA